MLAATSLPATVGERLRAAGLTIATAESCTGGLIAAALTDIPGSSDYVLGGVIAYTAQVKQAVLGVDAATIAAHGVVSAAVAQQMAEGVRRLLQSDLAVSVTGVAGPGGGTSTTPVGLTYLALSAAAGTWVREYRFAGDRAQNRQRSVEAALQFVLDTLDGRV